MIDTLPEYNEVYQQEFGDQLHYRAHVVLLTFAILLPLFSILDYVTVRDHSRQFLIWRISASLFCLFVLFLNLRDKKHRHPFLFGVTAYLVSALTISPMIVQTGGYSSFYYVGLILVLVTFTAIFPLTMIQTAVLGGILFAIYAVPIFLSNTFTLNGFHDFLANSFFFVTFIIIIVVQSRADHKARTTEFNLRMKEREIGKKLTFYAGKLEDEVRKKTKDLKESESRYRDLYENIIDDVILVDRDNRVLLANPRFYHSLGLSDTDHDIDFLKLPHPEDIPAVQNGMLDKLRQGENVTGFQFRLQAKDGKALEVECNATTIRKEGVLVGFQMLIRDISTRIKLERELLQSLKTVQETRTATILGLAKLSEYRDVHSEKHLERVREYCQIIAGELASRREYQQSIDEQYIEDLYNSSILHDIGKVTISDEILLKQDMLTPQEIETIRQHTTYGGNILKAVDDQTEGQSFLSMAKAIAYFHHEKWNGSGYPYGLREEEIPLAARIFALADAYDALTTMRKYRPARPHEEAVKVIEREKGAHFAPDIVDAFMARHVSFNEIRQEYATEAEDMTPYPKSDCCQARRMLTDKFRPDYPLGVP
ncbi:MAG: PAS domain S-box protein [Deltaproteobacteria bacterium]|nr:PAS domain S-box protein [Deltaproteobacteria bacterium]